MFPPSPPHSVHQVKAGTIFDNIIVTDDLAEAKALAESTWAKSKDAEKAMAEKVKVCRHSNTLKRDLETPCLQNCVSMCATSAPLHA